MNTAKHTPGPWRTNDHGVKNMTDIVCDTGAVAHVARWYQGEAGDANENAANATLIAASPDLLAACEAAEQRLVNTQGECSGCAVAGMELCTLCRVRAAIRKATGGRE